MHFAGPLIDDIEVSIEFQRRTGVSSGLIIKYAVDFTNVGNTRTFTFYLRKDDFDRIKFAYDMYGATQI
jgi:hypothetical protein